MLPVLENLLQSATTAKKPGHVLAPCRKRQAKMNTNALEEAPVQLLSIIREPSFIAPLAQKKRSSDSRFKRHCTEAELL